jgi:nephrocystin-4
MKILLPEGTLCGTGDDLIGLVDPTIPQYDRLTLLPESLLYVQNVTVQVPTAVENEVRASVKRYRDTKYRDTDVDLPVTINGRRLIVAAHNGWTFTNKRGL